MRPSDEPVPGEVADTDAPAPVAPPAPTPTRRRPRDDADWSRLSGRVVWVDLARSLVALLPTALATTVFGVPLDSGALWPLLGLAAWGVVGAVADVLRWLFTRYRVTAHEVERRTGILVRRHRSVRRERIRSVDTHARFHHRLAGLRVVTVGAGQQATAMEPALALDALPRADAERLRRELLPDGPGDPAPGAAVEHAVRAGDTADAATPAPETDTASDHATQPRSVEVLARLRPSWILYNLFSIWAYVTAAGLLWGAYWLASTFGVDLLDVASGVVDWRAMPGWQVAVVALVGGGLLGALATGVSFVLGFWGFELARVHRRDTSDLRTRRGLLSTREVNRDEARVRGLTLSEPLLWRWMGMTDTVLVTTGLSIWAADQPSAILPRGPRAVARRVARDVLGPGDPLAQPLTHHPRTALRRRLWWATLVSLGLVAVVALPVATGVVPPWVLGAAAGTWPVALLLGVAAYRSLGHTAAGDHVVLRSGMLTRHSTALRRDAVSTIALRQSVLQRRLGLATVSTMTAAGWAVYEAPDVAAGPAVDLALAAAPGLLDVALRTSPDAAGDPAPRI